ncbi:MAG: S-layer homology domain-containing protein [Lachnospirales bacterium]
MGLLAMELIHGNDGYIKPKDNATRAEVASIIMKLIETLVK